MEEQKTIDPSLKEDREFDDFEYPVSYYNTNLLSLPLGYVRWHWHEEVELIFMEKGRMECHIADSIFTLSAGTAAFINRNVLHSFHPINGEDNLLYAIVFHPSYLFGYGQTYLAGKYLIPILSSDHLKYLCIESDTRLFSLIRKLITINRKKDFAYELLTKSYLCDVWYLLLSQLPHLHPEEYQESTDAHISLDEIRVKKALLYIQTHYAENISLDDIAFSIHISRSECCRCFKRALHLTPFEYLMKYRIFQSMHLLQSESHADQSISELAAMVGFNNTSYYNKLFKKYVHCTPSEYRKQTPIPPSTPIYSQ